MIDWKKKLTSRKLWAGSMAGCWEKAWSADNVV